jgi:hypothetical protein
LATAMLTAEGTRLSARAAAENEPWSNTARNSWTVSEVKAMAAIYQPGDCAHTFARTGPDADAWPCSIRRARSNRMPGMQTRPALCQHMLSNGTV